MKLSRLLPDLPLSADPDITSVTEDSRDAVRGALFAALPGTRRHGRDFIAAAINAGAAAILTDAPCDTGNTPVVVAQNARSHYARACARFYGAAPAHLRAVTGTNGKTSTAWFAQQLISQMGHPAVSIGTLGIHGDASSGLSMTTPDPARLHRELSSLAGQGITHAVMEASSHGLHQRRLDGVMFDAAAFTNLTRDHLDYHTTMDDYWAAKKILFAERLSPDAVLVINNDTPQAHELKALAKETGRQAITYGQDASSDLHLAGRTDVPDGQVLTLRFHGSDPQSFNTPIEGAYQAHNMLAAIGLAAARQTDDMKVLESCARNLAFLTPVPGRLSPVHGHPAGARIFIDYAHTPDALDNVLRTLRPITAARLVCVFGCGGDRDPGKRPQMGAIAARGSDLAIITDDNPRGEDPAAIRAAIAAAAPGALNINDRRAAIDHAVRLLGPGDVLLIAGKGHEQGQIIAGHVHPFDDADIAAQCVAALASAPTSPSRLQQGKLS